jgi:hypothetical protein
MPRKVTVRKGDLRSFVQRVNSDSVVRVQFLADPAKALDAAGIKLGEKAMSELTKLVHEYIKTFPNIALLPTGLQGKSKERVGPSEGCEERILIL